MTAHYEPTIPIQGSSTRRRLTLGFDPWLLILIVALMAFGLVMVYSASWDVSWRLHNDPNAIFRSQLGHLGLGLIVMMVAAWAPIDWIRRLAPILILVAIGALFAVLLVNVGSAHRRAFLGGSIQPSEMAKLALIIYLAVWMESKGDRLGDMGYGFWPLIMIMGIVGGLILIQPDLSAGFTVAIISVTLFFLAGARIFQVLVMAFGGGTLALLVVRLTQTGQERWGEFIGGLVDLEEASYHVQQSLQAFYSGGIMGRGLGASRGKFGFLPAPHTDSIFSVIGEELGLIGALLALTLFCLFLWRGFRIAMSSPDSLETLLASGITFWIGLEAMINMSVLLGLLPFAGNALPFFSYGGSSLVTTLSAVGLLFNISRRTPEKIDVRGSVATLGVSRRNRRRRVSRLSSRRRARQEG
ncbi:MAG: cell division protein FtsW [Anaerolineaceae bacterium]|nr:MAG: cell division protein FtsW [Anaerolineaceae bacterium]